MARTSPLFRFVTLTLGGSLLAPSAWAGPKVDPLAPTRAKLDALEACLGKSDSLATLRKGLLWGWQKPGSPPTLETPKPPPPPDDYLETLDRDVSACQAGAALPDEEQRRAVLDSVRKDIAVKADDCRRFGMGRRVPVTVKTVRGSQIENGWQVFYKWSCAGPLQPAEVRAPNLTSPANMELPPGVYLFRAERKNPAGQVETAPPVPITVGASSTVPIELPIQ
jgi:hypothetical protein